MGRRSIVIVTSLLLLAACKKDKPAEPAADQPAGSGSAVEKPARPAPPPEAVSSKLGEKTGGSFAKVEVAAKAPTFATKIDISKLEQPDDDKAIQLMSAAAFSSNKQEAAAAPVESPGFKVIYNPSKSAAHEEFRKIFQQNRVFEEVAEGLNKTIRLPVAVDINTVDCNTINAFYDPNTKRIIVCYELVSYFLGVFKPTAKSDTELGNAVLGALIFSFFHESGHGLIHILDLAAVGREEDAVDQLATLILIASGDEGVAMAMSGAYWFQLQSKAGNKLPFWDEHAFDGQRFYNIMCLIYGSNPGKYGSFVSSGALPKDRAQRCPEEYAKINKAWERLLQPHLTNGAALNIKYKPNVPIKEAPKTTSEDPWGDPDEPEAPKPVPDEPDATAPHKITCEQVATKASELIVAEAQARAEKMSEEEVEALKRKLEAELPAVMEQLLAQCAKEDWSDVSRKCVMDSKTLDAATKCQ
jgi:hypothetical protein